MINTKQKYYNFKCIYSDTRIFDLSDFIREFWKYKRGLFCDIAKRLV